MTKANTKIKRWVLPKPINQGEIKNCSINYTLQKVLSRRGLNLEEELLNFLTPLPLPNANEHFNELNKATNRIIEACNKNEKIAICGDYDADGITSTVLLVELLSKLGANPIPCIPSRQEDGYGINLKMINDISTNEIKLVITVDNGISAFDAIKRSQELGIDLVITDHHKIPNKKIDIFALIHPEQSPNNSPYKCLAGVGIAYMLAINICKEIEYDIENTSAGILFCIGTVADMAPLVGANRKWLKECLPKFHTTKNIGIRAIVKKLSLDDSNITTEDIGFKIAPLINAVGRIGDPNLIIKLLTSTSERTIKKLTNDCFSLNKERKRITALAEQDALQLALIESINNRKFLVIINKEWHLGIIGIVAARIVDRYNLPTAILTKASDGIYRGSIRSNNQIKVNLALDECSEILLAYGGHSAAAGFTINEENIPRLKEMLNNIAINELNNSNIEKSIKPDACLLFKDINYDFYRQLISVGPFGIMNMAPIFWTRKCRVLDIYVLKGNHIRMKLDDGTSILEAIKWNCSSSFNINDLIDIAFYVEINKWKKNSIIQLNIIDIKKYNNIVDLQLHKRNYKCQIIENMKIKITNSKGQSIISELSKYTNKQKDHQDNYSKMILSFAEIALGKTA